MPEEAGRVVRICALALLLFSTKAPLAAADRTLKIPFEYAKGRSSILVRVQINNKPAALILDTGSAHTILCPEILGLDARELERTQVPNGNAGFMGDAVGAEIVLQVGDWKRNKRRVAVMDLSQVLSVYQEKIDGVLGLDFLQEFSQITINVKERTIILVEEHRLKSER